jgi:hypothetical protein
MSTSALIKIEISRIKFGKWHFQLPPAVFLIANALSIEGRILE